MPDTDNNAHRCAFTGHRPKKLALPEESIRELLWDAIIIAYGDGYRDFISGAADGVDLWAADTVLQLRETYPDMRLICALPFPDRKRHKDPKYLQIIENADETIIICAHYFKGCFHLRNKWMVDHCSRLIAVWNGSPGGTKNTIEYAQQRQIETVNLLEL